MWHFDRAISQITILIRTNVTIKIKHEIEIKANIHSLWVSA